ncbi:MAG: TIR domain-containing protein, partial [Microcystaceae cyanobacterium]
MESMSSHPQVKKILLLSANPRGTSQLRLDEEMREIKEGLRRAKQREQFLIESAEAVRYRDIRRAILDCEPNIVHFSGHGAGEEGLAFEDEAGQVKLVSAEALASLFELFTEQVECVVLNACYSQVQAKAIAKHIPCVVGMNKAIGDRTAIEFAIGFYDALGAGKSLEFAYKLGCNAIQIAGIPENVTPQLLIQELEARQAISPAFSKTLPSSQRETPMAHQRVFISYRSQEPDASLAQEFHDQLQAAEHEPFMAAESIRWGENWVERIDQELKRCDYFLLLLSERSAASEMVAGEVRTARKLRDKLGKPIILP